MEWSRRRTVELKCVLPLCAAAFEGEGGGSCGGAMAALEGIGVAAQRVSIGQPSNSISGCMHTSIWPLEAVLSKLGKGANVRLAIGMGASPGLEREIGDRHGC